FLHARMSELGGAVLAVAAAGMLVALVSYTPGDPSLNSATARRAGNLLGPGGAVLADVLVQSFGFAAYLLALGLAGWAWRLLRKRPLSHAG
ncbi:MAG: DNA translocase FtsK 4TM domain-containing protein, partial [Rhodospirillaceae bacterium]